MGSSASFGCTVEEKDAGKPFLTRNIDRAIVMTQYDLRGFGHPLGFRIRGLSPKSFDATVANLIRFAAGCATQVTDPEFVGYSESTFEEYLAMCKRLAACCDGSEREAIQLIVRTFIRRHKSMTTKVGMGKMKPSPYLTPLEKDNELGKAIIALATAFGVDLETGKILKKE